jgi:hypothetical protein
MGEYARSKKQNGQHHPLPRRTSRTHKVRKGGRTAPTYADKQERSRTMYHRNRLSAPADREAKFDHHRESIRSADLIFVNEMFIWGHQHAERVVATNITEDLVVFYTTVNAEDIDQFIEFVERIKQAQQN